MSVTFEMYQGNIGVIKVCRPEVRNAMDWETMEAFQQTIETIHTMDNVSVLIITGSTKAFIAGGDLKVLHKAITQEDGYRLSRIMTNALARLEALPIPVIAAINGAARGGGAEIAVACDLRVASKDATMGFVQISLGLIPGWGAGQRLMNLVGYSHAMEILMTGRILNIDDLQALGLVNRVSEPEEALNSAIALAEEISSKPVKAIKSIKRILQAGLYTQPSTASFLEQAEFPPLWASKEHISAVDAFLNRKKNKD